jgi:hypothetical protein
MGIGPHTGAFRLRPDKLHPAPGQTSPGLTAAAVLVACAAVVLAMLPVAVLLSAPSWDWLSPALTSAAAMITGTKWVAAVWGILRGATWRRRTH